MSAFETFIQLELPKRPYTETNTPQESVLVRRGPGPRQHVGVELTEGQVLGMVGGVLVGTTNFALRKYVLTVPVPSMTWTVPHNLASEDVIIQAFDENKFVIIPDTIQIVDTNTVQLTFSTAQAGVVRVVFLD
jgi:hypothetical protein